MRRRETNKVPLPDACRRLGWSRDVVLHRIHTKRLDGGQVLGRWYVDARSLERALAEQRAIARAITELGAPVAA